MLCFKYISVLNIPGLSIYQGSEFLELHRVYLFLLIWHGCEYASGCNYGRVLNIPGFWICQISLYARVTQGSEYAWTWLNKFCISCSDYGRVLNMPDQGFTRFWICLRFWICQDSEYGKVVNMWGLLRRLNMVK